MTSNEILRADILDILFDNRNKQYGAYALRKTYNKRLGMALGISLSAILLVFFLMRMERQGRVITNPISPDMVVVDHVIPPDIKKEDPPKKSIQTPQVKTQKLTTLQITRDDLVKTTVPDQRLLLTSAISNKTLDGIIPTDIVTVNDPVKTPVKEEVKTVSDVTDLIQREPEFPGGVDAWLKFLQKNLIAPDELEAGQTKTVAIRFSVSPEGVVTNFEIVKSGGTEYDNEVIRVLKKMPKWKPAIQNGQPVARAFTQPVTFMGLEQ